MMSHVTLSSPEKELVVKELPTAQKPQNFTDAVGDFTFTAELSPQKINAGETTTITITIEGDGSLDSMRELNLALDSFGKVYKVQHKIDNRIFAMKKIELKGLHII